MGPNHHAVFEDDVWADDGVRADGCAGADLRTRVDDGRSVDVLDGSRSRRITLVVFLECAHQRASETVPDPRRLWPSLRQKSRPAVSSRRGASASSASLFQESPSPSRVLGCSRRSSAPMATATGPTSETQSSFHPASSAVCTSARRLRSITRYSGPPCS